jgi:hypothetical protein
MYLTSVRFLAGFFAEEKNCELVSELCWKWPNSEVFGHCLKWTRAQPYFVVCKSCLVSKYSLWRGIFWHQIYWLAPSGCGEMGARILMWPNYVALLYSENDSSAALSSSFDETSLQTNNTISSVVSFLRAAAILRRLYGHIQKLYGYLRWTMGFSVCVN